MASPATEDYFGQAYKFLMSADGIVLTLGVTALVVAAFAQEWSTKTFGHAMFIAILVGAAFVVFSNPVVYDLTAGILIKPILGTDFARRNWFDSAGIVATPKWLGILGHAVVAAGTVYLLTLTAGAIKNA